MLRRSISWPLCNTCNLSLCSCCSLRGHLSNEKCADASMYNQPRILLYILRRDVRLSDNPAFYFASRHAKRGKYSPSSSISELRNRDDSPISEHGGAPFTHLLPVYVFSANQVESSGFLASPSDQCPYPEARSEVAKVWRTGPHRASFTAQGVWDLKGKLERLGCGSGLQARVGLIEDVVRDILEFYAKRGGNDTSKAQVTGIWMTSDDGTEERHDEKLVEKLAVQHGVDFKVWEDTKFYVDECVPPTMTSPRVYSHRTNADEPQS
jgi:deoxyribodipyrimidine photo-lyase